MSCATLAGFRGLVQSVYPTHLEAVNAMDLNRNGVVSKVEFGAFVRSVCLSSHDYAESLTADLCGFPGSVDMQERQLRAACGDVDLGTLRILLRAKHASAAALEAAMDLDKDSRISNHEWTTSLATHRVSRQNAARLFARLDVLGLGYISREALRVFRGGLAICDYRQLIEPEAFDGSYGSALAASLWEADLDGDRKVAPAEFARQAHTLCINETEAATLYSQLETEGEGLLDLEVLSPARLPFTTKRQGSLASFRMCLQGYFDGDSMRIMQDLEETNSGFPATAWGLVRQGARIAWDTAADMEHLFASAEVYGSGLLPRSRYHQLFAGNATLAGLRVVLLQVAPGGVEELLPRVDIDGNGALSRREFVRMCGRLGFTAGNAQDMFAELGSGSMELSVRQLQPVTGGRLSFEHLRLLSLTEFPPPSGALLALDAADVDRSRKIDFGEFQRFAGTMLAATRVGDLREVFQSLDVLGDELLHVEHFDLLTTTGFDLSSFRRLILMVLGPGQPTFAAVDTSTDGRVDPHEFEMWAQKALAASGETAARVFEAIDFCDRSELDPAHMLLLHSTPSVVMLRAMLFSRYGRDWQVFSTADVDGDGEATEAEFLDLGGRLMLSPEDSLPLFRALDRDDSDTLSKAEMYIISAESLPLFNFRRLASLAFPNASAGFELADLDGDGLVAAWELNSFACDHLALKKGPAVDALFQMFNQHGAGALPREYFMVFAGDVDLFGYRKLVHSMWSSVSDSFLAFDVDFDQRLSLNEMLVQASSLAISPENVRTLFAHLTERASNQSFVHWDLYNSVILGLAGFRTVMRKAFTDPQEALLDVDVEKAWGAITLAEFQKWCGFRFQLLDEVSSELFAVLDIRKEGLLRLEHIEFLLGASVNHRMLHQMAESAFGGTWTVFEEVDLDRDGHVTREEMGYLAPLFGVEPANVAQLFQEADVASRGFLTREQFVVMARPNHTFRLTNLQEEEQRFHVYELKLYADEACTEQLPCDLPIASGHFVNFSGASPAVNVSNRAVEGEFGPASAFDGDLHTRWVAACEPCGLGSAYLGCTFDSEMQVRCVELFQTAPKTVKNHSSSSSSADVAPLAKVAAGFRVQVWDGQAWKSLADIPKPPLWELGNEGIPLSFKTTIPNEVFRPPEEFVDKDERAARDFEQDAGMRLDSLWILVVSLTIAGLLVFCVCCPMLLSPWCMSRLRWNAPERMEARRSKHLSLQLESSKRVQSLEQAVKEKGIVTDEWGTTRRGVKTPEQQALAKRLEKERRRQARLEARATANRRLRLAREEARKAKKQLHLERFNRMREAYQTKTIAIDGVALRAPPAVLLELGFEPEMIEAFGLPGFDSMDDAEGESTQGAGDAASETASSAPNAADAPADSEHDLPVTGTVSVEDDDPLQIPPKLDEIMGDITNEGAKHRKRRGGMAGVKEGEKMHQGMFERAVHLAGSMQVQDLQEDDEVNRWIQAAEESEQNQEYLPVRNFDLMQVDEEEISKAKTVIRAKFDNTRRSTLLADAEVDVQLADMNQEVLSEGSEDEGPSWKSHEMQVFGFSTPQEHGSVQDAHEAALNAGPEAQMQSQWALSTAEREQAAYSGKVHRGMAVRPRGLGTPRTLQLDGEVHRSSLMAAEVRGGGAMQWGRFTSAGERRGTQAIGTRRGREEQAAGASKSENKAQSFPSEGVRQDVP